MHDNFNEVQRHANTRIQDQGEKNNIVGQGIGQWQSASLLYAQALPGFNPQHQQKEKAVYCTTSSNTL